MVKKRAGRIALALAVIYTIYSLVTSFTGETMSNVREAAPWVISGLLISEIILDIGIALVIVSTGAKFAGLRGAKSQFKSINWRELGNELRTSKMFWAGFALSILGGAGAGLVSGAGVITALPWRSWGLLVYSAADLGATVVIRRKIYRGVMGK